MITFRFHSSETRFFQIVMALLFFVVSVGFAAPLTCHTGAPKLGSEMVMTAKVSHDSSKDHLGMSHEAVACCSTAGDCCGLDSWVAEIIIREFRATPLEKPTKPITIEFGPDVPPPRLPAGC